MHPFPLDRIISLVEPGVSGLGLEGAMISLVMVVFDQRGYLSLG